MIAETILHRLLPKGRAWQVNPDSDFAKLLSCVAKEIDRLYEFYRELRAQARPKTATMLLPEWAESFGIDRSLPEYRQRALANAYFNLQGNQSVEYIQSRFDLAGYNTVLVLEIPSPTAECGLARVGVAECGGCEVVVTLVGSVPTVEDLNVVRRLWEYHVPLHRAKSFEVEVQP